MTETRKEVPEKGLPPVYAATYDHHGVILWGLPHLRRFLEIQTSRLEKYPEFRLGWDHEAFTYDYLAEHEPELLQEMRAALNRFPGRLGVGSCTYGQPLSMFIDGESNIRQLTLALDTVERRLGVQVPVYLMSEHPFHAQLPQLLAGCGFKGAILRTHFMMYGHNPEFDAPVGWWRGADGSRLPAVPTYIGQGATLPLFTFKIPGPASTMDNRIMTDAISERCALTLADFRRTFGGRVQPLIATRADDARSEESLIEAHLGDPDYRWVLMEEIFGLLPHPRAEFDIGPNGFKVRMPWGYCGNWIWNRSRQAETAVLTAERLAAIGTVLGGPPREEELENTWKDLLIGQHHDIQVCGMEKEAHLYLGGAIEKAGAIAEKVMSTVAPRIGRGRRLVVFNPLPWERREPVELDGEGGLISLPGLGFTVFTPQKVETRETPAMTWQTGIEYRGLGSFSFEKTEGGEKWVWHNDKVNCLMTPYYKVYTGMAGGLRLVKDRRSGTHLLAPPKVSGTLAGLIDGRDCISEGRITEARTEHMHAVLTEEGEIGGLRYTSTWTFYAHTRRIDWRSEIEFAGQWVGRPKQPPAESTPPLSPGKGNYPETVTAFNDHEYKLRLRFFPGVGSIGLTGVRDLPFHIAVTDDPYVEGLYWTAVTDGRVGLALFNRGLMGSVREKDGAFASVLAFSLPYVWSTRSLAGEYRYELGIYPFEGDWRQADLHRRALEYNFPCPTREVIEEGAYLGESWTPCRFEGQGAAMLSALYTKQGRTYARFCEYGGGQAEVSLDWLGEPVSFTLTDMREREGGVVGRRLLLEPWQVQTVRLD